MSHEMLDIVKVWDSGDYQNLAEDDLPDNLERTLALKERTGASRVVELRWTYQLSLIHISEPTRPY